MLTTHNLRMLNPAVSQTPLCQELSNLIPRTIISSKTVDLRKFIWVDGEQSNSPLEVALAEKLNDEFYNTGKLNKDAVRHTELIDPLLHNLYLFIDSPQYKDFCSVSPAPCCGLFHEIILREQELDQFILSKQQVEVKPERFAEHGSMINQHNGTIKAFSLPRFEPITNPKTSKTNKPYIILEFEVDNFNVATGMVGVGLPSVTVFGIFISNFIQKESIHSNDVKFAIGIHNLRSKHRAHGFLKGSTTNPNSQRKSNIQGYIVIDTNSQEQSDKILERLNTDFKIAGCQLLHKRVMLTNEIPQAYWMKQMDDEVQQILDENHDCDALDIAFDFAIDGRLSIPVAVGFALFESPIAKPHMPNFKYPHAWAETLFKSTELKRGDFSENYLYKRTYNDGILLWQQS